MILIINPLEISKEQASFAYADEAEVSQPGCLSDPENLNAYPMERGLSQPEELLNRIKRRTMKFAENIF